MKIYITSEGFVSGHIKKYFSHSITDSFGEADIIINTVGILKEEKHTYEDSHIVYIKKILEKIDKNQKLIHFSALGVKKHHPSGYKHTKAVSDEMIKSKHANHVILKPSIILGDGQKLYDDLKKFQNFPVVFAPKMKIQPVEIERVLQFIKKAIDEDLKGEYELCGDKIVTMKKLFQNVFNSFGKNPYVLEMPKSFFKTALPILSLTGIMSKDEYLMLEDNICKG